jgi:uncharacterized cupin superfamily protein
MLRENKSPQHKATCKMHFTGHSRELDKAKESLRVALELDPGHPLSNIVESGEWRVESGEWRVESGEWRVESGEWRVESGEWRV